MQSYDEHISPVLGGNDTLRNEQKRKRHLEAWSLSVTSRDFLRPKRDIQQLLLWAEASGMS